MIAATPGAENEREIVRALADPAIGVRLAAAELAGRHRIAGAADALIGWLSEPQANVREAAARALSAVGDSRALPALIRLLGDAEVGVRRQAIAALAAIGGTDATVPLLDRLADPEGSIRVATAQTLGALADSRAVLSLLGTLQDALPDVREASATALGHLGDVRAVRGLTTLMRDGPIEVRTAAIRAVGNLRASDALLGLAQLTERDERGSDPLTRAHIARAAVEAIGQIGGPRARDLLVQLFRRSSADPELSLAATAALRRIGVSARDAIPALVVEPVPAGIVTSLVDLLGDLGADAGTDALLTFARNPDYAASTEAILRALGRTGTPRALHALLAALEPESSARPTTVPGSVEAPARVRVRRRGAVTGLRAWLERNGTLDPEALDPLVAALASPPTESASGGARDLTPDLVRFIGATTNPRANRVLTPLLASTRADVRAAAAYAMAHTGVAGAESALAARLADRDDAVRLAASDALGRHGDGVALAAIRAVWAGAQPIDRTLAARAMARIASRSPTLRVADLIAAEVRASAPALAAGYLDALAWSAAAGEPAALATIASATQRPGLEVTAVQALGNSLRGTASATRDSIRARLQGLARSDIDAVRATAVWMLSRAGGDPQPTLTAALRDPASEVVTNAAGGLARLYSAGTPPTDGAIRALCDIAFARRQPFVRANALRAVARAHRACDSDAVRRALFEARSETVRDAAAELLAGTFASETDAVRLRRSRAALEHCAGLDADAVVAEHCRSLLASTSPAATNPQRDARGIDRDALDAFIVLEDDQRVAREAPVVLAFADGVLAWLFTGPDGWVHERPAPVGSYGVLDPTGAMLER